MSIPHALLALLAEESRFGLQLKDAFEARTGTVWPLNVGQVYTTLQRLERDGLVESEDPEGDGPQKGYRLTEAGGRELATELGRVYSISASETGSVTEYSASNSVSATSDTGDAAGLGDGDGSEPTLLPAGRSGPSPTPMASARTATAASLSMLLIA